MPNLVPSLAGSVTISALLHGGYYGEKKKKKANGGVGHNSCPGTNWWALIGAQRKLVPTGCAACSRRTAVASGRGAFRPDSRGLDAGGSAISLSTSQTHQSPTHRASQMMVFKTDKSKKATAGHQRRREREQRELAARSRRRRACRRGCLLGSG